MMVRIQCKKNDLEIQLWYCLAMMCNNKMKSVKILGLVSK